MPKYNPLTHVWNGPLDSVTYADREMQGMSALNQMTSNGWKTDEDLLAKKVAQEAAKRDAAVQVLAEKYGMPTHAPDRFKLTRISEWTEPRTNRVRSSYTWRTTCSGTDWECEDTSTCGHARIRVEKSAFLPTMAAVKRYKDLFPEAAVRRGYAVRIPGEEKKSPWSTTAGKAAIIAAFGEAGATKSALMDVWRLAKESGNAAYVRQIVDFGEACLPEGAPGDTPVYPVTDKSQVSLSKHTLGSEEGDPTWFCPERRKSFPTMWTLFGHLPGVVELCELLLTATGARNKFAEIASFVTPEGRVHARLGATQASGRFGFKEPSLTNVGARGAALEEREVMVADDGEDLIAVDLAQADIRAVAIQSQDPKLISFLQPGQDFHTRMAGVFFGEETPATRKRGKPISLGIPYGQGAFAIAQRNRLPQDDVQRALDNLEAEMPDRSKYLKDVRALGERQGWLDNGYGRNLHVDPSRAYTQAPAQIGQSGSRELMVETILRAIALADQDRKDIRPHLRMVVHDALICSVPKTETAYWQDLLKRAGTFDVIGPKGLTVPILCDPSKPAYRWSDCDS